MQDDVSGGESRLIHGILTERFKYCFLSASRRNNPTGIAERHGDKDLNNLSPSFEKDDESKR